MNNMTRDERPPIIDGTPANDGFKLALSWLWVAAPLAWGIFSTVVKSLALFK